MKKIGLCLAYKGTNYGQNLQALATQTIIEKLGFETEIIDYISGHDKGINISLGVMIFAAKTIFRNAMKKLDNDKHSQDYIDNNNKRIEKAKEFRKLYYKNIITVNGYTELKRLGNSYDAVVVGSDQLWTPGTAFTNFYTLRFVPDKITKVSYATSLGVAKYPRYVSKSAKSFMERIDFISVREKQGQHIVEGLIHKSVNLVVDPTYLLTQEEWNDLIPSVDPQYGKYALFYFLGADIKMFYQGIAYAKNKGLKTVCIMSNETEGDYNSFDEVITGEGPCEFINAIRYAEIIFTDSFHGVAFSVINNKDFYVYYRKRNDVKVQRNSRIDNILELWHLQNRLILDTNETLRDEPINYPKVKEILDEQRKDSMRFLINSLNNM